MTPPEVPKHRQVRSAVNNPGFRICAPQKYKAWIRSAVLGCKGTQIAQQIESLAIIDIGCKYNIVWGPRAGIITIGWLGGPKLLCCLLFVYPQPLMPPACRLDARGARLGGLDRSSVHTVVYTFHRRSRVQPGLMVDEFETVHANTNLRFPPREPRDPPRETRDPPSDNGWCSAFVLPFDRLRASSFACRLDARSASFKWTGSIILSQCCLHLLPTIAGSACLDGCRI